MFEDRPLLIVTLVIALILALIGTAMYVFPRYDVWSAGLKGEAELARAEQNRKIATLEAQAKLDSAKLLAGAEVERAKGIAQANAIVAGGLKGNEEYLRYLWIDKVAGTASHEVIYIPTEAGLPILEASRHARPVESP